MTQACQAFILAGCTATGKTEVAGIIAEKRGWPLLSADAMLVYRGMDIGTAKPGPDQRSRLKYAGIDCVSPDQSFSSGLWMRQAARACREAAGLNLPLLVVGGTGLYLKLLLTGMDRPPPDPGERDRWQALYQRQGVAGLQRELATLAPGTAIADPENPRRLIRALETAGRNKRKPPSAGRQAGEMPVIAGLRYPRELLHKRIKNRVEHMWRQGLLEEARILLDRFPAWSDTALHAIGYREALAALDRRMTPEQARELTIARTRRLAKKQETWFRHQLKVAWVDAGENETCAGLAKRIEEWWRDNGPVAIPLSRFAFLQENSDNGKN